MLDNINTMIRLTFLLKFIFPITIINIIGKIIGNPIINKNSIINPIASI